MDHEYVVEVMRKVALGTRLNMLFIPTLPVKPEFTSILRIMSNAKNAEPC